MVSSTIPHVVIERLPLYLRCINLLLERGHTIVPSQEMARNLGISSAQLRKDLSYFGEFGKQGMGYDLAYLREQLERILHLDRLWHTIIVGAGDLGHALANYAGFEPRGFRIVAAFDTDPDKIGQTLGRCTVYAVNRLHDIVHEQGIKVAIIAVPPEHAQEVADQLVAYGIRAILNYAGVMLNLPDNVQVSYIDPVVSLQSMTYYLDDSDRQD